MTPERILASALQSPAILSRLGPALRSDLANANPYYRRIIAFADDFLQERGKLPLSGDYELWLSALPEAQGSGTSEALGRLQMRTDIEDFDPDHLNEVVLPELRQAAVRNALARLNAAQKVTPELFRELQERVEGLGSESRGSYAQVRCFEEIPLESVKWVWNQRIPRGAISELVGEPGVGKSTAACAIAGAVSRGRPLPGELQLSRKSQNVLILSAEDIPGMTIRPRLENAGADLSKVHFLDGIEDECGVLYPLNLRARAHRQKLAEVVDRVEAGLVIIDPIAAYLGATDSHRDSDVRGVLSPLSKLAEESMAAMLLIRHLNKNIQARKALHRAGGSIGFSAAVRSSLLVGPIEEGSSERAVISLKHNLSDCPDPVGFTLEDGVFQWLSESPDVTAADLLQPEKSGEERSAESEAVEWLRETLREGPVLAKDLQARVKTDLGCSWQTVKRAKGKARVKSHYNGEEKSWSWSLEDEGGARGSRGIKGDLEPLADSLGNKGDLTVSLEQGVHKEIEPLAPELAFPMWEKAP